MLLPLNALAPHDLPPLGHHMREQDIASYAVISPVAPPLFNSPFVRLPGT